MDLGQPKIELFTKAQQEFKEKFLLLETAEFNSCYNFFDDSALSKAQLSAGAQIFDFTKNTSAKRLCIFGSLEYKRNLGHLADYFKKDLDYVNSLTFDKKIVFSLRKKHKQVIPDEINIEPETLSPFVDRIINTFQTFENGYYQLLLDLISIQAKAIQIINEKTQIRNLILSGFQAKNPVYLKLLNETLFDYSIHILNEGKVIKKI